MTKDKNTLTKQQAKKMVLVKSNGMVHTFFNLPFGIIGGDHAKKSVFKDIDDSFMCKLGGEQSQALGHGLVVIPSKECRQEDLLFVETKLKKVKE